MRSEIPDATLESEGWALLPSTMESERLDALRDSIFDGRSAGTRCLLDHPLVADAARLLLNQLIASGHIAEGAVAIQAIAFDKTAETNWKVAWHQDLMFPFARRVTTSGYDLPTVKDGVDYARPPCEVLERLLAVRLHLDDCGDSNGPLRVSPGTHHLGIISRAEVANHVAKHGQINCLARKGGIILMRPLTLHASSPPPITSRNHSRVGSRVKIASRL